MAETNLTGKELVQIQTLKAVKDNLEQQIAEKSCDNQKVATNTVTFGDNDTVKIVAGSHATVVGDASAKTITIDAIIPEPEEVYNQRVKAGTVTFEADAEVNFVGEGSVTVTAVAGKNEIKIKGIDTNTTYTIATGSENGTISVKASTDATATDVAVKGLDNAAYKDVDTTVTKDSDKLVTSGAVAAAVANLAGGMVFQGSVGDSGTKTWANIGTASTTNKGHVYKVITKHTTAPVCEVGDLVISNGTEWVVVPSGDDVRSVVYNTTDKDIKVDGTSIVTAAKIVTDGAQTVSSTSHGVALGGTSAAPTVTVTPGSIAEDNTSVVTGGDVYTAITSYAKIIYDSSLAGEEITTIKIGEESVDVARFDQRGSFFYRGSIDPIIRPSGAPNPALMEQFDFHDQDVYFYDEANELWQYSSSQGGAMYKVFAVVDPTGLADVAYSGSYDDLTDTPEIASVTEANAYLGLN